MPYKRLIYSLATLCLLVACWKIIQLFGTKPYGSPRYTEDKRYYVQAYTVPTIENIFEFATPGNGSDVPDGFYCLFSKSGEKLAQSPFFYYLNGHEVRFSGNAIHCVGGDTGGFWWELNDYPQ